MNRGALLFVMALSFATWTACKRTHRDRERAAATELPPLASPISSAIAVDGFGDAVVSTPTGSTRPMPVVVAVLGIGDNADDQCSTWRELVGPRAFVLCPRGAKRFVEEEEVDGQAEARVGDAAGGGSPLEESSEQEKWSPQPDAGRLRQAGYWPVDAASLEREVSAGLSALKARYGAYVSDAQVVYAGFSRGAFLGASLVAKHPERFARVVLIEGGHTPWQPETAASFARGGGKRVLFVCGQPKCVEDAEEAVTTLRGSRVEAQIAYGKGEGHGYRKQVKDELRRSFDWVVEGDLAWSQPPR